MSAGGVGELVFIDKNMNKGSISENSERKFAQKCPKHGNMRDVQI